MAKRKRAGTTPFSKVLIALMDEKGLTIRKTAQIAGVPSSTLDSWRSGALPEDYSAVARLARHFGVSMEFILTGEEQRGVKPPTVAQVFVDKGPIFDGYAKIVIHRMVPRSGGDDV